MQFESFVRKTAAVVPFVVTLGGCVKENEVVEYSPAPAVHKLDAGASPMPGKSFKDQIRDEIRRTVPGTEYETFDRAFSYCNDDIVTCKVVTRRNQAVCHEEVMKCVGTLVNAHKEGLQASKEVAKTLVVSKEKLDVLEKEAVKFHDKSRQIFGEMEKNNGLLAAKFFELECVFVNPTWDKCARDARKIKQDFIKAHQDEFTDCMLHTPKEYTGRNESGLVEGRDEFCMPFLLKKYPETLRDYVAQRNVCDQIYLVCEEKSAEKLRPMASAGK